MPAHCPLTAAPELKFWANSLLLNGGLVLHNQIANMTRQLDVGVRQLALDIHWIPELDEVLVCHASDAADQLCPLLEAASPDIPCNETTGLYDYGVHTGCSPNDPTWLEVLTDLSDWVKRPENQDEFVVFFIENQADNAPAGAVVQPITTTFGTHLLTPAKLDAWRTQTGRTWPTVYEAVHDIGANAMFWVTNAYTFADSADALITVNSNIVYPDSMVKHFTGCPPTSNREFDSYYEDDTKYVFDILGYQSNSDGNVDVGVIDKETGRQIVDCQLTACFDLLNDADLRGMSWTWAENNFTRTCSQELACVVASDDGWLNYRCDEPSLGRICVSQNRQAWTTTAGSCPVGYTYDIPRTATESVTLRTSLPGYYKGYLNVTTTYDPDMQYCKEWQQGAASSLSAGLVSLVAVVLAFANI